MLHFDPKCSIAQSFSELGTSDLSLACIMLTQTTST